MRILAIIFILIWANPSMAQLSIRPCIGGVSGETMTVQQILENPVIGTCQTKGEQVKQARIRSLSVIIKYKDGQARTFLLEEQIVRDQNGKFDKIISPAFGQDLLKLISQLKTGDKLVFEDFKVLFPDSKGVVLEDMTVLIVP